MKQLDLSFGLARNTDPETSHEAGASVDVTEMEQLVCNALAIASSTTEEIAKRTGLSLQTITPRMRPLVNKGRIIQTQMRRPGASGRLRIVWQLVTWRTP